MIEKIVSDCCGVPVYREDICTRCKEHCEKVVEMYPDPTDPENVTPN